MQNIGEKRSSGKQQREQIQPERGMSPGQRILSQPELQEQRGKSDRSHYDQRQRAVKGGAAGVEHDQRQGQQQQSGGNDSPTAGFERRRGMGTLFGQGIAQSYTGAGRDCHYRECENINFKRRS